MWDSCVNTFILVWQVLRMESFYMRLDILAAFRCIYFTRLHLHVSETLEWHVMCLQVTSTAT